MSILDNLFRPKPPPTPTRGTFELAPQQANPVTYNPGPKSRIRKERLVGRSLTILQAIDKFERQGRTEEFILPFRQELADKRTQLRERFDIAFPNKIPAAEKLFEAVMRGEM